MAKQKGIIPLVGTIGGINFYYLNGKPVARSAGGGFNAKAIKTKASMQRVRENGSEFGHCSRVNKTFREALRPFYHAHKFTFFHSRLMSMFTALKDLDPVNERGKRLVARGVETETGRRLLREFQYTPKCVPHQVFPGGYSVDWSNFTLQVERLQMEQVFFIVGATHISIQFGVLDLNFYTLEYDLHLATPILLAKTFAENRLHLSPPPFSPGPGVQMAVLGIRYYQEIDGAMYQLNAQNGVGIAVVGVR